ncbi:hypothetical protein [Streptomyces tendae]|uniref:hypothetical protein n=1 Tax=Streptomyces tendae TaxID=1932 RepID=UPI003D716D2A
MTNSGRRFRWRLEMMRKAVMAVISASASLAVAGLMLGIGAGAASASESGVVPGKIAGPFGKAECTVAIIGYDPAHFACRAYDDEWYIVFTG